MSDAAALASASLSYLFSRFRISASVVVMRPPGPWHVLYYQPDRPDRLDWELRFDRGTVRGAYNAESLKRVARTNKPLLSELEGYTDLYLPIVRRRTVTACVVCGPFLRERPTAERIRAEWERLSGRPARDGDPELVSYCGTVLRTPLLDARGLAALRLLARTLAGVISGALRGDAVLAGIPALTDRLTAAYPSPLTWVAAEGLVDPERSSVWRADVRREMLSSAGIRALPTSVILVLPVFADDVAEDPVARAVAIARLQRACIPLARSIPDALAGRVATEGLFLLFRTDARRVGERRAQLRAVAERIALLAGEHGAHVRMGASAGAGDPEHVVQRYQEALVAAQQAMYEGRELVVHGDARRFVQSLPTATWHDALVETRRALLSGHAPAARLDIDAAVSGILARSRGSAQSARAYLESAFLDAVAALRQRGAVDAPVLDGMASDLEIALSRAPSAVAAASAFRDAYLGLVAAVEHPNDAAAAHRIGRAARLVDRAFAEPLGLARVAKEAGLSPAYFSRLFKRLQGTTFERRLLERRLERAKELLRTTSLPMHRVAREAGFNSYAYFATAFRKHAGASATSYRDALARDRTPRV